VSGKSKTASTDKVIWCDRGWQPVWFGFCPSAKAWRREMKRLGSDAAYPTYSAAVTEFESDGKVCLLVTMNRKAANKHSEQEVLGLLVHEATHVWQAVRRAMREDEPSREFEAYSMQAIFQSLHDAMEKTWGVPFSKKGAA